MSSDRYYQILGVSKTATADEIKKAYRKLAVKWHPDRNPDKKDLAEKKFKEIAEAYACLSDPDKRKMYDRFGESGVKEGAAGPGGFAGGFPGGFPGGAGGFGFPGGASFSTGGFPGGFSFTSSSSSGFDPRNVFEHEFGGASLDDIFAQFTGGRSSPFGGPGRTSSFSSSSSSSSSPSSSPSHSPAHRGAPLDSPHSLSTSISSLRSSTPLVFPSNSEPGLLQLLTSSSSATEHQLCSLRIQTLEQENATLIARCQQLEQEKAQLLQHLADQKAP